MNIPFSIMKPILLLCLVILLPLHAQQRTNAHPRAAVALTDARQLSIDLRQKANRISPDDLAAIKRILDKYPETRSTNAPAKPKPAKK